MLAGCSLDQPEHKIAFLEGSWLDLPVVVMAQTLLVDGGSAECQQPALFQQVDAVFSRFLGLRLHVHGDLRRVELDVSWDDSLDTIYKEERSEAG